CLQGYSAPCSF
nr:immunoglobulin light chain junction region [Macaca mulatta]